MGKEIRVEGREGNKVNGRIYTPGFFGFYWSLFLILTTKWFNHDPTTADKEKVLSLKTDLK